MKREKPVEQPSPSVDDVLRRMLATPPDHRQKPARKQSRKVKKPA